MDPVLLIALLLLLIGLGIFGAIHAAKVARARREALAALAGRHGLGYVRDDDARAERLREGFEPFAEGHSQRAYNTLVGEVQWRAGRCDLAAGDFEYRQTHGSGKNRRTTTYEFSYLVVGLPFACPDLHIRAETVLDRIAQAFGFDDIDFESDEFSRRFHVRSRDRRFAHALIQPRSMELLLEARPEFFALAGGRLCLHFGIDTWSVEEFERALAFARAFLDLWPEHLLPER
ncbi:MAG: hypothetical protein IT458_05080 [Planctomycetes bacterium]|nr:hypothetical protein [Planctomycetota bacterium]